MLYLIVWLLWGLFKCTGDIEVYMMLKECEYILDDEADDEGAGWQSV